MADVEEQQQQQEPQEQETEPKAEEASEAVEAPTEQNENGDNGEEAKPEESVKAEEPDADEDDRKLFVGGLSWETVDAGLRDYMSQFGEVESCTIKQDSNNGRSRCFGFVIFKSVSSLAKVNAAKTHLLDGKNIDVKKAEPQRREGKLFVGGIKSDTTDDKIKEFFGEFGKIEKFERPYDQRTGQPKGFCFLTFSKDGPIKEVTKSRFRELDGKSVECKHAEPPYHGGGRRGRGRGGMGWNQGFGGGGGYGNYNNQGFGMGPYHPGNFGPGFGGYGGGYGGGFNQGYGGGGGYNGNFGFGGGGGSFGGYNQQQQSGYGKSGRTRPPHMNNFKPY